MLKTYYGLVKPGIVYGNAVTALGGFFLAEHGRLDGGLLLAMLSGLSLVIASGGVWNNYIDRDIDKHMERTKDRALARGIISGRAALTYATILGCFGLLILTWYTNLLAAGVAFGGLLIYVGIYSLWAKRRTAYAAHLGSLAGAVPPVVGYCAVTGRFDTAAGLLFLMLCLWQMPHFFSLALYRKDEYAAAGIPVFPLSKGVRATKVQLILYLAAFVIASDMLTVFGYAGYSYLFVALAGGTAWLALALRGFVVLDEKRWARRVFLFSLVVLTALCVAMALDAQTPTREKPTLHVSSFVVLPTTLNSRDQKLAIRLQVWYNAHGEPEEVVPCRKENGLTRRL